MSYIQNGSGGGGSGTVTSVGLGADSGAILVVSGSPVTTSGTLQLQFNAEPANTVFAGPTSGPNATPTFRALVFADLPAIPSGTILWNQIGNASGNLTLANAGNTTTFNQTSAVAWLWANTTTATSGTTNASPLLELAANYWTGAASASDLWTIGSSLAAGTNGTSTLKFSHAAGSTGANNVVFSNGSGNDTTINLVSGFVLSPSIAAGNSLGTGSNGVFYSNTSVWTDSSVYAMGVIASSHYMGIGSSSMIRFSSTTAYNGTADVGLTRTAIGVLGIGNGTTGNTAGTLALSRLNGYNADMSGSVSSAPTGVVATNVVVAVGAATATFTVSSTEGFTIGDTVTLSASGWTGGSGLASTTATVTTVTSTTSMILTRVSGGPWVAGTYAAQTGTLTETGGTSVSVIYATAYTSTPIVVVTPTSNAGAFYISASSTTGFTVTYANSGTQTFNYQVIGNPT